MGIHVAFGLSSQHLFLLSFPEHLDQQPGMKEQEEGKLPWLLLLSIVYEQPGGNKFLN
jgi:hypothetical protein